jgi:predicted P-loop ATPase
MTFDKDSAMVGDPPSAIDQLNLLGYTDGDNIFFRSLYPQGVEKHQADRLKNNLDTKFPNIPDSLLRASEYGRNIYCIVNGGGHADKDVIDCRAIFYEHDDGQSKESQLVLWQSLGLPEPTFQLDTGGKSIHSYWVFDIPILVADWVTLQTDLLNYSEADRSIKNPSRIMRLAGFPHQKTGELAKIVTKSEIKYSFEELRQIVPATPEPERKVKAEKSGKKVKAESNSSQFIDSTHTTIPIERLLTKAHRSVLGGVVDGSRNNVAIELACDLIGVESLGSIECDYNRKTYTLSIEQNARQLFTDYCRGCTPSLEVEVEERTWNSAGQRDREPSIRDRESLKNCARAYLKEVIGTKRTNRREKTEETQKTDYPALAQRLGITLLQDDRGNVKSKLVELTLNLFNLLGKRLKLNQMTNEYEFEGKLLDLNHIKSFISQNLGCDSSTENCIQAVHAIASRFAYHPVRDYLDALNGSPLVDFKVFDNLATLFLGNSDPLANRMLAKTLIGAVARVKKPGTKVDTLTVLQGGQGFLKSTFLKVLAGDAWFCDDIRDLENKDEIAKLARYWLIELAEVDYLMGRKEVESFKRFLSTTADTYRPPYGRSNIRHERTCALFATTNKSEFLKDPTGSRRYWVIKVGAKIDCDLVAKFRDIIWATALAAYERGDTWWLDDNEESQREAAAVDFQEIDPWQEEIESKWVSIPLMERDDLEMVQVNSIFQILDVPIERRNQASRNRIGAILRNLGFENKPIWHDNKTKKLYVRFKSLIEKTGKAGKEIAKNTTPYGIHNLPVSENKQVRTGKGIETSEAKNNTPHGIHALPESLPVSSPESLPVFSPNLTSHNPSQKLDGLDSNPVIETLVASSNPPYPSYPFFPHTLEKKDNKGINSIEIPEATDDEF